MPELGPNFHILYFNVRFSPATEDFLIAKIFPRNKVASKAGSPSKSGGSGETIQDTKMKGYTNFR